MSLTVEDRVPHDSRPSCVLCGGPLHATIVGPRCPVHGVEGLR